MAEEVKIIERLFYTYVGSNGVIRSPVKLPNQESSFISYELTAPYGKLLTDGAKLAYNVLVSEEEKDKWYLIDLKMGQ